MKKSLLFALLSTLSICSYADSAGTISSVVCHVSEISPVCHVALNGGLSLAPCATTGWHYTFNGATPEGKNILSILLAAQLSKQMITIGGKGVCTLAGGSEDLRHVYITTKP
jgi:hypothetical protein